MRVLLAGGGTAGHINPMIALADELRQRDPEIFIVCLGTSEGLEARLVPEHGLQFEVIPRVPLPRRPSMDLFRVPTRLRRAVAIAEQVIRRERIDIVVGFGGYVATPAYVAARRVGVPVVVHEQNIRPGLANRLGARWAKAVGITFRRTQLPNAVVTGLPLRQGLVALVADRADGTDRARRSAAGQLGLDPERVTLVVSGGSLGAASVNAAVAGAASTILRTGAQVLHLTGKGKSSSVEAVVSQIDNSERWHIREYLNEMELGLAVADLVIGRAGAGTVCELTALGIPGIYVPLPIGNGEQRLNAAEVVEAGGGVLVADEQFSPQWISHHVVPLLTPDGGDRRVLMAQAAEAVGVSDGAKRLADLVEAQVPTTKKPASTDPVTALGHVHLIGIGGVGMSAVATLLRARGLVVSGSDAKEGPALPGLRERGITVTVGHDPSAIRDADTIVVSSAVRSDNPELVAARARNLTVVHRSEALAALMEGHPTVAVAGAHGKTTTSAMIAVGLLHVDADPSFAIGGVVHDISGVLGGARAGAGPFVAEADESDGSFLAYSPDIAVVTNVEPDHLDHYGTREAFEQAFVDFAERIRPGGLLVVCGDDPGSARLSEAVRRPDLDVITYGVGPDLDVQVGSTVPDGKRWLTTLSTAEGTVDVSLAAPGEHNALNAAAAWIAIQRLGFSQSQAARALGFFSGTGRRFEDRGTVRGVRVIDDYAHHPTEVAALVRAARQVVGTGRVLVVFQPHLFSRTKTFAAEFGAALGLADRVVITDIYAAREDPDPEVTSGLIVDEISSEGARWVPDLDEAARVVADDARQGDLILTVGAGDITRIAPVILDALGHRDEL